MNIKNYILLVVIIFVVIGYFIYQKNLSTVPAEINTQSEEQSEEQIDIPTGINKSDSNKIYSIQEILDSNLLEGEYVKVRGVVDSCIDFRVTDDYEGFGSGCYLVSRDGIRSIGVNDFLGEYMDKEIIVGGYIEYCGGRKIPKYICGLSNVELLEVIQ